MAKQTAIVIGAGPAGLTAAYELLSRTQIRPVVLELSDAMGGISQTIDCNGYRMDLGGHRFFSKSDRVMDWWLARLPLAGDQLSAEIAYHNRRAIIESKNKAENDEDVMLLRPRKSRIYFAGRFFDYPLKLSPVTFLNLGVARSVRILAGYLNARLFPRQPETCLEDFYINRFGSELYETFFRAYTEKVWGVPCREISAEWGAQRVKGLSISKAVWHALRSVSQDFRQKQTETSLVEQFLYPKYGPGQMWETTARQIQALDGEILTRRRVCGLTAERGRIKTVTARNEAGETEVYEADFVFSTMPIQTLIGGLSPEAPADIRQIANGLLYRDFIIVGLLVDSLYFNGKPTPFQDNWIYLQDPDILAGRLQIFNNWSDGMVKDQSKVWVGVEYFCNETDELWQKSEAELVAFAAAELVKIGMLKDANVRFGAAAKMPKTYPAYFGTYNQFDQIIKFLDGFENLFPIGRNGMHKYNNQDHSMLTAMTAVDNIVEGRRDKANIWAVNTEEEYLEEK